MHLLFSLIIKRFYFEKYINIFFDHYNFFINIFYQYNYYHYNSNYSFYIYIY